MGLKEDIEAIEGFEDAWKESEHPVFASKGNLYSNSNNLI
jgi:hypothetical protein